MKEVVEPRKELKRDNDLEGEVTSEPDTQVRELNEDGDHFESPATGGLITHLRGACSGVGTGDHGGGGGGSWFTQGGKG